MRKNEYRLINYSQLSLATKDPVKSRIRWEMLPPCPDSLAKEAMRINEIKYRNERSKR